MRTITRLIGALVAAVLAMGLVTGLASTALAAPSDATLSLTALQSKLDSSGDGTVPGYFKTVDKGSTIETIPVTILAITGGATANSSLIMFEATGPKIDKWGGIVAGMSGSPVYVSDGGTDKVVGAVSYGDYFTKGGTGLATPISAMQLVQSTYLPEFVKLSKPLVTTDGPVKSIIIAPKPQQYSVQSKQGAFVASPLSSVFIGGLDPSSAGYKLLAQVLAYRGQTVVPVGSRLSGTPAAGAQSFETTLVPGAAVAALESRGDMWIGGVGTVTYTDTDTVLAFGHPAAWSGPSSLYMTNAWIDGVWPSTYEPYKLARPTALRGTITQDRSAGVMGTVGDYPDETTFTAHAFSVDNGRSATSTVYMPRQLLDSGIADFDYLHGIDPITAATGLYVAGQNLMDAQATPGSAEITTTVMATDGTTTYTVTMPNRVDTTYDVPLAALQDAVTAINTLQQIPTDGVHTVELLSVDLSARYTTHRDWAQIVGVRLPSGLKVGANPVKVSAIVYGQAATQTIDATLTIPAGTSPNGSVIALSQSVLSQYNRYQSSDGIGMSAGFFDPGIMASMANSPSRKSLAEAAKDLNSALPNNVVSILFVPNNSDYDGPSSLLSASLTTTVSTGWVFNSSAQTSVTRITAAAIPSTVGFGGESFIQGGIMGPSTATTVAVYATPVGGTEQLVDTLDVTQDPDNGSTFEAPVGPVFTTTIFRIHYDGTGSYSSADAVVVVTARAAVGLGLSATRVRTGRAVTLKATVRPGATAGGQVTFELNDRGSHWRAIGTRTLAGTGSSATASIAWKVVRGKHKVRARFLGSASNAGSTSVGIAVTGR